MAPRNRSHTKHTASNAPSSVSIADLPAAVLIDVMGCLRFAERQRAALVCKRFAAAACSPELLQTVDTSVLDSLAAVRSLAAWLARHGRHVRQFSCSFPREDEGIDLATAINSCLVAAAAHGQLRELTVFGNIRSTEWLPFMRSLELLMLLDTDAEPLPISPTVSMLTALRSLELEGNPVMLDAAARLPPSITHLRLYDQGTSMPLQVVQLTQLAALQLDCCAYQAAGLAPLSRLAGSLTRLEVTGGQLPPCLSALGRLQCLGARHCQLGEEAGVLSSGLQHLTRLTQLVLHGHGLTVPAAMAGLPHLRRCYLSRTDRPSVGAAAAPQLPVGHWLHNLHWLGIDAGLLDGSAAALDAAPALEFVELVESSSEPQQLEWQNSPTAAAFVAWLAQHPPLARVSFERNDLADISLFDSQAFAMRLLQLGRSRPSLRVRCSRGGGDFFESMWTLLMPE